MKGAPKNCLDVSSRIFPEYVCGGYNDDRYRPHLSPVFTTITHQFIPGFLVLAAGPSSGKTSPTDISEWFETEEQLGTGEL
jgi:hypothetical protein